MTLTKEQIDLLILNKIIPQGCPKAQIDFFATVCEKKKLDPMLKQIHLVERKSKDNFGKWVASYTIQAGIDGMRVIAQRNCKIKSYRRWTEQREDDLYGICEIDTEDRGKYYDELPFKEYVQTKSDGTPNTFWTKFKQTMLKKCAEESVLRMMAPEDLSGVYGDDEMLQADSEQSKPKELQAPKAELPSADRDYTAECEACDTLDKLSSWWGLLSPEEKKITKD
ncbi:MAG: recombinase RecT [Ignavibacteriales bacterium]|nr:recombinase RecT [Ignavibacteriales bacterium]